MAPVSSFEPRKLLEPPDFSPQPYYVRAKALQRCSDETPKKLVKRILLAGGRVQGEVDLDAQRGLNRDNFQGTKNRYWFEQACRHRLDQRARATFIEFLEKQAVFCEYMHAENVLQEQLLKENERLVQHHFAVYNAHVAAAERARLQEMQRVLAARVGTVNTEQSRRQRRKRPPSPPPTPPAAPWEAFPG